MGASDEADTADLGPIIPGAGADRPRQFSPPRIDLDVVGVSDRGRVRETNEDHFLIIRFGRFLETVQTNLADRQPARIQETGYGMFVADGVGGHAAGEVASELAIRTVVDLVLATPDWILRLDDAEFVDEMIRRARERFAQVQNVMVEEVRADTSLQGYGTTMIVAWSVGKTLFVAHLGDSRAYLLRQGELRRLTRDHTLAQALADRGMISEDEIPTHRLKRVLTQALGDRQEEINPDVKRLELEHDDRLLLCSDGLTDMVDDGGIAETLGSDRSAADMCQLLVGKALEAGGKDNVTAVVARYKLSGR
jgi:serine/threonine protein phosphatase PrpC